MNPYVVFLLYLLAILGFVFVTLVMNRAFMGAFCRILCAQGLVGIWKYERA